MMDRRGFLKGLLGFGAIGAAGILLPDVEPVRRFWQVGANAPVAAREPAFERYIARKFGLRMQVAEDLAEIERSLRAPVNPAVLRFEQSVLRAAKNGDAEALAYAPVIGAVRDGKDASGLYAGPPIFGFDKRPTLTDLNRIVREWGRPPVGDDDFAGENAPVFMG